MNAKNSTLPLFVLRYQYQNKVEKNEFHVLPKLSKLKSLITIYLAKKN